MNKIIYGTLRECVDELWKMVFLDEKLPKFPRVDYAASVIENADSVEEAYKNAEGWFGFVEVGGLFNCDTFSLFFAHYGGGGVTAMEIEPAWECSEKESKELLMRRIGESTDSCGYGVLEPGDYTVFEIEEV